MQYLRLICYLLEQTSAAQVESEEAFRGFVGTLLDSLRVAARNPKSPGGGP